MSHRTRKPHRLPDDRYIGRVSVAFTVCVDRREPLFTDAAIVQVMRDKLALHAAKHECKVTLYCFMPDHLHTILFGQSDDARPRDAIDGFKTSSGMWLRQYRPETRLQDDYFDRIIRDHDEWRSQVIYILNNPVRVGLVSTFEEYPHLGCNGFTIQDVIEGLW